MFSGDLGRTAVVALTGGAPGLEDVGLEVAPARAADAGGHRPQTWRRRWPRPARPRWSGSSTAPASRCTATATTSRIFTRNLNDITDRLPSVADGGRALPVRRVVLDGESIGLDDGGRPHRFQDTMSRFAGSAGPDGSAGGRRAPGLLLRRAARRRRGPRGPAAGRAARRARRDRRRAAAARRSPTADPAAAEAFAARRRRRRSRRGDGEVARSTYQAGRRGGSWRKVKPVRTLDLVVLAAEWGHGRRTGWLSNLHLGARGPDGGFVMVGKTFKGLTDDLLRWQTERLQDAGHRDRGPRRARPPGARRGDRARRRAGLHPLPGWGGAALRPGAPLPGGQARPPTLIGSRTCRRSWPEGRRSGRGDHERDAAKWQTLASTVQECQTSW